VEGFDFVHRERVRFRDLDSLSHVNNAVFLTYLEEARIGYLVPHGAEAANMILARVEIDFRAPLREGDAIEIGVRPSKVGTKSFELEYEIRRGDTVAAEAKTVLVSYDYSNGRPVELPDSWREALVV
jgi:acyl-CoA thioester hydrolase